MSPRSFFLWTCLFVAAAGWARTEPTVYVTFDKSDAVPENKRRELADSAQDLREQLGKRDGVRAAEDERHADVRVTILDRRLEVNETGRSDWGGALSQAHYQSRYIVFFRFESDELMEESEIALAGAFVTWKRVAGVLAKDVEEWALNRRR